MQRPASEALRTLPRDGGELRVRVLALLSAIGEQALEAERGAALQPACEALRAGRSLLHGSPVASLRVEDVAATRAFLRTTLALHSEPGVALDALPAHAVLRIDQGWRVLLARARNSSAVPPAPACVQIVAGTVLPPAGDPRDSVGVRVRVPAGAGDAALGCALDWPFASPAVDPPGAPPSQFWRAPLFTDARLVEALRAGLALKQASAALEALRRRVQLLRQDQLLEQSLLRVQEPRRVPPARTSGDGSLRLVADTIAELVSGVRERMRRASTRGSWLWSFQANALGQISRASIARDERRRITRLAVNEEQIRGIESSFLRSFRGTLSKETEALRRELDALCATLEQQLGLPARSLAHDFPRDQALWNDVAGHAAIDVRYRGEIQRRGFMERLAEGRKVVFLLLMVGSLAGSFVGFNLRQSGLIGIACLALFVGTIAWSYRSWAEEENEAIDRETDKLTDLVEAAIVKATGDTLREATNLLVAALEGVRKQLLVRIEGTLDRGARAEEARLAEEGRLQQARLARIDASLRQLGALEAPLQRHATACEALAAEATRQLQSGARTEPAR